MSLIQVTTVEQWELQHLLRKAQKVHAQMYHRHDAEELTLLRTKHERLMARIREKLEK